MYQRKFICYTFLLIVCFRNLVVIANDIPSYCSYYDPLQNFQSQEEQNKDVHYCLNGEQQVFAISDLALLMKNIEESTMKEMSKDFQKLLAEVAYKKVREKRNEYNGLYQEFDTSLNDDLKSCDQALLRDQEYQRQVKKDFNKEKQKDILILHLINSLKVNALFEKNKNYYTKYKKLDIELNQSTNTCRVVKRKCESDTSFWKDTYHCQEGYDDCIDLTHANRDNKRSDLNEEIRPLYDMVQKTPLLFDNKVEGGFFDGILAENLSPSQFQESLIKALPQKTKNDFQHFFNSNHNENDLNDFFSENSNLIEKMLDDPKLYKSLVQNMQNENRYELDRLDEAAKAICHASGETLHHNEEIVNLAMEDYLQNAKSEDDLKDRLSFFQGSHCFLLKTKPEMSDEVSGAAIGGMALLGIGFGLQIIPFVGNIAGGGLIIAGTSLSIAGGATLAGIGIDDGLNQTNQLEQNIGLQSAGLTGYQKLLDSRSARDTTLNSSIINMGLLPLDLWGLNYFKNVKKYGNDFFSGAKRVQIEASRRLNIEQRQVLDNIEKTLGNNKGLLLGKYVDPGYTDISKPDSIYLAAIADMAERKIKMTKFYMTPSQKRLAVQNVIDHILKRCAAKKQFK